MFDVALVSLCWNAELAHIIVVFVFIGDQNLFKIGDELFVVMAWQVCDAVHSDCVTTCCFGTG